MKISPKTLLLLVLLLAISFSPAVGQNASLFVGECVAEAGICEKTRLVRFDFKKGILASKKTVLVDDELILEGVGTRFVGNRFLVTRNADVVDLLEQKILYRGYGHLVEIDGTRIIERVDNRIDREGVFYFDISDASSGKLLKPGRWGLIGLLSPNKLLSAESNEGSTEIWLHRPGRKKRLLGKKFWTWTTLGAGVLNSPPVLWLDDENILTQTLAGRLVKLSVSGSQSPVVEIPAEKGSWHRPRLFRDGSGRIIYYRADEHFAVNVEPKTFKRYTFLDLGNGFEYELERNKDYGHIIRFHGEEIGRVSGDTPIVTPGYLAMDFGKVGSTLGWPDFPDGIRVWSEATQNWQTLKVNSPHDILGWIDPD